MPKTYQGQHDRYPAHGHQRRPRLPAPSVHRSCRKNPGGPTERRLPENDYPDNSVVLADRSRQVDHRDKQKHHDAEQQAGPADPDPGRNTQRRSDQRDADAIDREHAPRHVRRYQVPDKLGAEEMQGAEDRDRAGKTCVAQGHDLVQAARLGDLVFCGQYSDHEQHDAGRARGDHGAGAREECRENGGVHGSAL